jgi:hypothetical protein
VVTKLLTLERYKSFEILSRSHFAAGKEINSMCNFSIDQFIAIQLVQKILFYAVWHFTVFALSSYVELAEPV